MLGKLIKYDLRYLNRFLIFIHGFLILSALFIRFFLTDRINFDKPEAGTLLGLAILLYSLLITGITFATQIIIAVRFYKNLFSDEGYLTLTLPVSRGKHLLSKTISGSIWISIDLLLVVSSICFVIATPYIVDMFQAHRSEFLAELGFVGQYADLRLSAIIVWGVLFILLTAIGSVIMIHACIVLGQLFTGHRILGSVVVYFVLSTVISLFAFAFFTITGTFSYTENYEVVSDFNFLAFMIETCKFTLILSVIIAIILYVVSYYILKKKLDLP